MVKNKLAGAVQLALAAGAASSLLPADAVQAQQPPPATDEGTNSLEEVVVTGTRVRRVDVETASPVFVLDSAAITQSGAVTVGDLVSKIPAIAGAAVNGNINNGGGFGEANIELRGLDAKRTLILIDGRRVNLVGSSGAVDVNQIPLNLIDHVDVLKEGAGAIYGSDAIAGVVNFITRKDVDGLELSGDWGESSKHDAQHHNLGFIFGGGNDRLTFQVGGNYNKQDALSAGARQWSKYALYLYSGSFNKGGSGRTSSGAVTLPTALATQFGCPTATLKAGAVGTSISDYRCFQDSDKFNFQPYNFNLTPQERGALFTKANYKINDYVEAYTEMVYNHTHSAFQLAPLPFDANADQVIISKDNIYNPFGTDFGGGAAVGGVNPNYALRLSALGDRRQDSATSSFMSYSGLKGKLFDTGWRFDANVSYSRLDQTGDIYGYLFGEQLQKAVGPSFIDPINGPTCGTVASPILNCTPANIFNLTAPGQAQALNSLQAFYTTVTTYVNKAATLDMDGPIFKLPAGDMLGSVGLSYTDLSGEFQTSSITQAQPPLYLNCQIAQEACGGNSEGHYNVKEAYVEVFAPILADLPLVHSLNVDAGIRYSDYSLFGSTTRSQFRVEYRPIRDLLLRGSFAQVFRAPTINDISKAPAADAPTLNDPCAGYTGGASALYPNLAAACRGVPTDGSFQQPQNQITGLLTSNASLKPETGKVKTFGFVYDPSYVPGLSVSADYWDYSVDNLITQLDPNYTIQQCAKTAADQFCSLLSRYQTGPNAGQFISFLEPTFNLGTLKTTGVDVSVKYVLRKTPIGDFNFEANLSHLNTYVNTPAPGADPQQVAGTYNKQFGFYAKNRGTVNIGWSYLDAEAMVSMRYIGSVDIPLTDLTDGTYLGYHLPSVQYYDLTAGYTLRQTNTKLRAGLLNAFDKTPPIGGINSFSTSQTVSDTTQYDAIGRTFFVGFTQKF